MWSPGSQSRHHTSFALFTAAAPTEIPRLSPPSSSFHYLPQFLTLGIMHSRAALGARKPVAVVLSGTHRPHTSMPTRCSRSCPPRSRALHSILHLPTEAGKNTCMVWRVHPSYQGPMQGTRDGAAGLPGHAAQGACSPQPNVGQS